MSEFTIDWSNSGLQRLTVEDLRTLSIAMGLKGYSGKKKQELINALLTRPVPSAELSKLLQGIGWKGYSGLYTFVPPVAPPAPQSDQVLVVLLYQGQALTYLIPYTTETAALIQDLISHDPNRPVPLTLASRLIPYYTPQKVASGLSVRIVLNFFSQ